MKAELIIPPTPAPEIHVVMTRTEANGIINTLSYMNLSAGSYLWMLRQQLQEANK